jgi:hypothetical protein
MNISDVVHHWQLQLIFTGQHIPKNLIKYFRKVVKILTEIQKLKKKKILKNNFAAFDMELAKHIIPHNSFEYNVFQIIHQQNAVIYYKV